jgi:hypothetical protein
MVKRAKLGAVVMFTWLLAPALLHGQQPQRAELLARSRVTVDGTSNRDAWTVKAGEVHGHVLVAATGSGLTVSGGSFTVPAGKMVSTEGVIMDRLMHGALKASAHPNIVYELGSPVTIGNGAGPFSLPTTGRVTIAGVTKDVAQDITVERQPDGSLRFTGSTPVILRDFGITPPTAMFGALRTGNRVVVNFELFVKP